MKKMVLFFFSASLVLTACEEGFFHKMGTIEFVNNTEDTICVYCATGFYCFGPTAYPDTLLPPGDMIQCDGKTFGEMIPYCWAVPHRQNYLAGPLALLFNDDGRLGFLLPLDTLSVFFIDLDTLRKYGYDTVRERYLILNRYDIPMDTVIKNDYKITYP